MKKLLGLIGLVAALGCAKGNDIESPTPYDAMNVGTCGHITDGNRTINVTYLGPEDKSLDRALDDVLSVSMYEILHEVETINFHIGGSGQVYAFGFLISYNIENDNDSDSANNVMEFTARHW
jgi:hypothetical protein